MVEYCIAADAKPRRWTPAPTCPGRRRQRTILSAPTASPRRSATPIGRRTSPDGGALHRVQETGGARGYAYAVTASYYAEVFSANTGRCFRMISHDGQAGPVHCPDPVRWHGRFRDRQGRRHRVDACDGHRGPLEDARPISSQEGPG
jgi:hypothetical protein